MTKNIRTAYRHPVEAMIRKFEGKHRNWQNVEILLRKLLAYLDHKPWPEAVSADEFVRSRVYDIWDFLEAAKFHADSMSIAGGIEYLRESMDDARRLYHLLLEFPIGAETVKFVGEALLETADFEIDSDPDPELGNFWYALEEVQWLNQRFPEQQFRYQYSTCLPPILQEHPIEDSIPGVARLLRYLWGLNPEFFEDLIAETLAREIALFHEILDEVEATLARSPIDQERVASALETLIDAIDTILVLPVKHEDWHMTLARAEELLQRGGSWLANTESVASALERMATWHKGLTMRD